MSQKELIYEVVLANMQKILRDGNGSFPNALLEEMGARRFVKLNGYPLVSIPFLCSPTEGRISGFGSQMTLSGLVAATYSAYVNIQGEEFTWGIMQLSYEKDTLKKQALLNLTGTAEASNTTLNFPTQGGRIMTPEIVDYVMGSHSNPRIGYVPLQLKKVLKKRVQPAPVRTDPNKFFVL
jgi:hypothetical protein